jgi:hypothetical protein
VTPLQVALSLAEEYGIPIIPCRSRDEPNPSDPEKVYKAKSPRTKHGFEDGSCNLEQIEAWWKRWPDSLVGIRTGEQSGIFVVDIDPLAVGWYQENAAKLAAGRIHKTKRGYHLLFKHPQGFDNSTGALPQGVDCRGEGGLAIWWPAHGGEAVGDISDINTLPAWVSDTIRAKPAKAAHLNGKSNGGMRSEDLSRDLMSRVGAEVRAGRADYQILQDHINHPHVVKQTDRERAIKNCIEKARNGEVPPDVAAPRKSFAAPATEEQAFSWLSEFRVHSETVQTVQDLFTKGGLVLDFGESGTGKSTFKMDMLLSVAHKLPFRGLETQQGLVVYLAGEGSEGVEHRAMAWRLEHPDVAPGPFAMWRDAVNFRSFESVAALVERIRAAEAHCSHKCAVVAVDTLMRCLFGSDNDPEHMSQFIAACDYIRREIGCAVVIIHHSGKDSTRGARGHSMLRAAVDTEIEVTGRDGVRFATVTKQRDILTIPPMGFELRALRIGTDARGRPITACVVDHKDVAPAALNAKGRGRNQDKFAVALKEWVRAHPDTKHVSSLEVMGICKAQGLADRRRRTEVLDSFVNSRILTPATGGYTLHGENL